MAFGSSLAAQPRRTAARGGARLIFFSSSFIDLLSCPDQHDKIAFHRRQTNAAATARVVLGLLKPSSHMSTIQPSWKAEFEGSTLHISGVAKYPNDFSTASLERVDSHAGSKVVSYRVVFHRDKEPFCDLDLIGPVHYYERNLPRGATHIRVAVGTEQIEFPIQRVSRFR